MIAIGHACHLQDLLGIAPWTRSDVVDALMHLNAKVEGEKPVIAHLELAFHFSLKVLHLLVRCAHDDQVVHIDADECLSSVATATIDIGLVRALLEAKGVECVVETCSKHI
jgi:hypothetical protein